MPVDWAVLEFKPKPGYEIYAISFDANMNDLPHTENALLLVPCHTYLSPSDKGVAVTHRWELNGEYEVSGNYFKDYCGGWDRHIAVVKNQWRERRIEILRDVNKLKAWARDSDNNWQILGECGNISEYEIGRLDFMSEIQYDTVMDLPAIDPNQNRIILSYLYTNRDWRRPNECLYKSGERTGTWARIAYSVDDLGRFQFNFWIER